MLPTLSLCQNLKDYAILAKFFTYHIFDITLLKEKKEFLWIYKEEIHKET